MRLRLSRPLTLLASATLMLVLLASSDARAQTLTHPLGVDGLRRAATSAWLPSNPPSPPVRNPLELFNDMSCPVAGYCVAVGVVSSATGLQLPLIVTDDSSTAAAVSPAMPPNQAENPQGTLLSVACAAVGNCTSVGTYAVGDQTEGLVMTLTDGSWRAREASLPADADTIDQSVSLGSVSCPQPGKCTIIGTYRLNGYSSTSQGGINAIVLTQSKRGWTTSEITLPAGFASARIPSMSCPAPGDCVAVGDGYSAPGDSGPVIYGLVIVEISNGWTAEEEGDGNLASVSCPAPGWCAAVASGVNEPGAVGDLLTYSNGTWTETNTPAVNLTGAWNEQFSSLSCPEVANCTLVGYEQMFPEGLPVEEIPIIVTDTGGSLAIQVSPQPGTYEPLAPVARLSSVACTSRTSCTAIGAYTDAAGTVENLIVTGSGTTWSAVKGALPRGRAALGIGANSVAACVPAGPCVLATSYEDAAGLSQGLLYSSSGESWGWTKAPVPAGTGQPLTVELAGVSCQAASCVAVGTLSTPASWDGPDISPAAVVETLHPNGRWSARQVPLPFPQSANWLPSISSVSCASATSCSAFGWAGNDSTHGLAPFVVQETAGVWSSLRIRLPYVVEAASNSSISCLAEGTCVLISSDNTETGSGLLLVVLSGRKATVEQVPLPANASSSPSVYLWSVSCATSYCVVVGFYEQTSGVFAGFIDTFSGDNWTSLQAPAPADASVTAGIDLFTVACDTAGSCAAGGGYALGDVGKQYVLTSSDGYSWTAFPAPAPKGGGNRSSPVPLLTACGAAGCAMAGAYGAAEQYTDLLAPINSHVKAVQPTSPDTGSVRIAALGCGPSGLCVAVGTTGYEGVTQQGLLITGTTDGDWLSATAPLPPNAAPNPETSLTSLACESTGNCYAVGSYVATAQPEDLMETYQP